MQSQFNLGYWNRILGKVALVGTLSLSLSGTVWGQEPGSQPPAAPVSSNSSADSYVIGSSDLLGINVWKESELSRSVPVRSDGKISLPLIGEIVASGRTPLQLQDEIATKLRAFISAPDVNVMVLQMNSQKFNVLGRVAKPGSYPLTTNVTALDAIAAAGGFQDFAKQKNVYVLRKDAQGKDVRIPFNYKAVIRGQRPEENILLKPNDTIVVP
jgi:polysaccharide export outer membrane protein